MGFDGRCMQAAVGDNHADDVITCCHGASCLLVGDLHGQRGAERVGVQAQAVGSGPGYACCMCRFEHLSQWHCANASVSASMVMLNYRHSRQSTPSLPKVKQLRYKAEPEAETSDWVINACKHCCICGHLSGSRPAASGRQATRPRRGTAHRPGSAAGAARSGACCWPRCCLCR